MASLDDRHLGIVGHKKRWRTAEGLQRLNMAFDQVVVRPGTNERARSHWYFRQGALLAVDAMNEPRSYMVGKRLIEAGRSPLPGQVADAGFDLKSLI